ncbi:hypothetical protein TRFO_18731 [Tritrichomonas foetus]|uniref:Initiator binding domain-containing protein n=1 Tax=Tritrichomonas foetus TaxID=1144522 RepID=A0A1J4KPX2_9EUKA|nr:hypothetical protein TRFO_18731 [Tritrichomonas foetus]|eukprot:OHT11750.1 hypothetical protein TRFO_18731 [Tritrichomonas foetus]
MQPSSNPSNLPGSGAQQFSLPPPPNGTVPPSFNGQLTATGEISVEKSASASRAVPLQLSGAPFSTAGVNVPPGQPLTGGAPAIPAGAMVANPAPVAAGGQGHQRKAGGGGAARQKTPKAKVMPTELDIEGPTSNTAYQEALNDQQLTVSPQALGFLPSNYWLNLDSSFGELVTKFFQRKNNANCRFPHKLYNALAIVQQDPKMYNLLGVKWITDNVFKVDKLIFGRVLGISSIDGGLFHRQGNFPSHGFKELNATEIAEIKKTYDVSDVDQDRIRLMHHPMFSKTSDEDSVNRCKWCNTDQKE